MSKTEFTLLQDRSAGFVTRMFAFLMDLAIVALITTIGGLLATLLDDALTNMGVDIKVNMAAIYVFFIPFIWGSYYVMFWSLTGRTVGKWFMGLKVINSDSHPPTVSRSVVRFIGYGISAIVFWLGYVWVLIDEDRRAWHDHFAKTWVIYDQERHKPGKIYETYSAQMVGGDRPPPDDSTTL
jgi:uncharacterized RDD family membrane protein YckC